MLILQHFAEKEKGKFDFAGYGRETLAYPSCANAITSGENLDPKKFADEFGDKIAVGVSAGKDSLTLLCAMAYLRRFYPKKFELIAITIDMGFEGGMDFTPIKELCEKLNVTYHVEPSNIAKIIFDVRKESNPCSLFIIDRFSTSF